MLSTEKSSLPPSSNSPQKLVVIGGSHSVIWGGGLFGAGGRDAASDKFEGVDVRYLGSGLAYHLLDKSETGLGKTGISVFENIRSTALGLVAAVVLCIGESDIRTEIVRQAYEAEISIQESVKKVTRRLITFSSILHDEINKPIFIWEPPPSATNFFPQYSEIFPFTGHTEERNYATLKFSEQLQDLKYQFGEKAVYPFGILPTLMSRTLRTNSDFYFDGCHLNHKGMEQAICAFNETAQNNGWHFPDFFKPSLIKDQAITRLITDIQIKHISSTLEGEQNSMSDLAGKPYIFSTASEENPFILLQIGYDALVTKIEIFNRLDSNFDRAANIAVAVGNKPNQLELIHRQKKVWGENGEPLVIEIEKNSMKPFSFISLFLYDSNFLQLSAVNVYEASFLASA